MYLIFDTETTGLPKNSFAPITDFDNWPRMVQLAWEVHDKLGNLIEAKNYIIKPDGYTIPYSAEKIHGISTEKAMNDGLDLIWVLKEFNQSLDRSEVLIGHNIEFDIKILGAEFKRTKTQTTFFEKVTICTKEESTEFCALPGGKGGKFKWPNLFELHNKLFNEGFSEAHNASADVAATARCFLELMRLGVVTPEKLKIDGETYTAFLTKNTGPFPPIDIKIESNKSLNSSMDLSSSIEDAKISSDLNKNIPFTHLHIHTQYSILDGAADISGLINKAKNYGMTALAITDHGNMFGVKEFHNIALKNKIKPILGCEVYIARRSRFDKSDKSDGGGYHMVLLAKNAEGYHNLVKLVSYGWTEGFYYKPRIDKELLKKFATGLIATSACLNGEIPYIIRNENKNEAKKAIEEYKSIFGEDFYLELQRHPSGDPEMDKEVYDDQVFVNKQILELAVETHTKYIATNDVHFINKEDAAAHDRLLCISTASDVDDPNRLRYTQQEWFKTQQEMAELFSDVPEALSTTQEISDKIEIYELNSNPIMPDFPIPEGFEDEDSYLRHITYEGAKKRYPELPDNIKDRIEFELETIKKMGFPGYFLIVWDFIKAAREMDVSVGPGRGSAAGSVVAYCLKITDIDPIKYNLLFERFLNPDRISMPDVDIDFDEDGRDKVLQWVVEKYGKKRVAHIITFGTMAPKMAIRDVARVQKLELQEADRLAKLVPERPGTSFEKAYKEVPELSEERNSPNALISSTLKYAEVLEGSVRQTGIHACGIIIGKDNLENYIPISTNKDAELYVTQYDGKHIEAVGMLKMDFLGLKTLSIIKDTVDNIKVSKGIIIDIDNLPLDDADTFELYSRGETTGLFQFESDGMKKHLRALKPNRFEDLIAMNALYRPGPMEYIPHFIDRKHGKEKIEYDLPEMEEFLKDTYGITVYQEQVMLLSQKLAGFSKGMADSLRKAMGKKIKSMMDDLKEKFVEGCRNNGYEENKIIKIWRDWEAFAQYAFNKSHSTCYAYVSYQTAYLKAHFPAEFMAAVLSRNLNDIKKVSFFMDECKRMGLKVLVPDINESYLRFTVNKAGNIRFGLAAIKGVGEAAVEHIITERQTNGAFKNIFDFVERVNLSTVNKRSFEAIIMAGGFDSFEEIQRHQFFEQNDKEEPFLESLIKYGNKIQNESNSAPTLFGDIVDIEIAIPTIPICEEWPHLVKLNKEKEVIGIYLSAHPLDDFKLEIDTLCNTSLTELKDLPELKDKEICVAGIVSSANHAISKKGNPYGVITLEDYSDSFRMTLFGRDYEQFRNYMYPGYSLLLKGSVQQKSWPKDNPELEFRIKSIAMLSSAKEELIKSILIRVPLENLTGDLIENLQNYIPENGGKIDLKFYIYDKSEGISIEMFSRNRRIALTDQLVDFLKRTPELDFKLN
ncbi:MAG: DNA polymerase III subunit alpha [Bacteroidales bacterium]|nr:DNA polymerase III subunit alpha [Bacteroidales bacterium]